MNQSINTDSKNSKEPQQNLFTLYANNKDADQPAHPRSLINAFVVRCFDSIIHIVAKSKISSL